MPRGVGGALKLLAEGDAVGALYLTQVQPSWQQKAIDVAVLAVALGVLAASAVTASRWAPPISFLLRPPPPPRPRACGVAAEWRRRTWMQPLSPQAALCQHGSHQHARWYPPCHCGCCL